MPDLSASLRELIEGSVHTVDVDGIVRRRRLRRRQRRAGSPAVVVVIAAVVTGGVLAPGGGGGAGSGRPDGKLSVKPARHRARWPGSPSLSPGGGDIGARGR